MSQDKVFSKAPRKVKATPRRSTFFGAYSSYSLDRPLIDLTQFELLNVGDILEEGDEYYYRPKGTWFETQGVGQKVDHSEFYRRRLRIR